MCYYKQRRRFVLISPVYVANNFIRKGKVEDIEITPLKVQKLVYFLYREYLKETNELLFSEQFEVWSKGPVIPSIYVEFRTYGNKPIKKYATDSEGVCTIVAEKDVFKNCIDKVWAFFKDYTGEQLSELTHREGTAWSKAKATQSRFLDVGDIKNEQWIT